MGGSSRTSSPGQNSHRHVFCRTWRQFNNDIEKFQSGTPLMQGTQTPDNPTDQILNQFRFPKSHHLSTPGPLKDSPADPFRGINLNRAISWPLSCHTYLSQCRGGISRPSIASFFIRWGSQLLRSTELRRESKLLSSKPPHLIELTLASIADSLVSI